MMDGNINIKLSEESGAAYLMNNYYDQGWLFHVEVIVVLSDIGRVEY